MSTERMRIVSPNGHLGFAPTREGSFEESLKYDLDYLIADSGSDDIGPTPLGRDHPVSPREWQYHDLELMLLGSVQLGKPMLIGSAGDTGTNKSVDLFVDMIKDIAKKHDLPELRIGYFYSDVDIAEIRSAIEAGVAVEGLDGRDALALDVLDRTERIVAVAGAAPYIELLEQGVDVIIGGRGSDCAVFAAPAIHAGFPEALSYYMGKVLECASFCAEPYGGKESVVGEITVDHVDVRAMAPHQSCTPSSVAGHSMYERSHPFYETVAGGRLDMSECAYVQIDEKTTRITGPKFVPADEYRVKLEGAGFVGNRYVGFVGVRDPYTLGKIDDVIAWARDRVEEDFGTEGYELYFHQYGRNAVLGKYEFVKELPHELGIVVDAVAADPEIAQRIATTATRQLFYARLPEVKGTAGGVAYLFDEVVAAPPAYEWTLNHTIPISALENPFPTFITTTRS